MEDGHGCHLQGEKPDSRRERGQQTGPAHVTDGFDNGFIAAPSSRSLFPVAGKNMNGIRDSDRRQKGEERLIENVDGFTGHPHQTEDKQNRNSCCEQGNQTPLHFEKSGKQHDGEEKRDPTEESDISKKRVEEIPSNGGNSGGGVVKALDP